MITEADWLKALAGIFFFFLMFQEIRIGKLRRELDERPSAKPRCKCGRFLKPGQNGMCPRCRSKL